MFAISVVSLALGKSSEPAFEYMSSPSIVTSKIPFSPATSLIGYFTRRFFKSAAKLTASGL